MDANDILDKLVRLEGYKVVTFLADVNSHDFEIHANGKIGRKFDERYEFLRWLRRALKADGTMLVHQYIEGRDTKTKTRYGFFVSENQWFPIPTDELKRVFESGHSVVHENTTYGELA